MGKIRFEIEKGTLGGEPTISFLKNDTTMAKVSIASNQYFKNDDGEWEQKGETSWINAVAFGYPAEIIESLELQSGDSVFATGTMELHTYEDKDGDEITDWNFKLDRLLPIPKVFEDDDDSPRKKKKKKGSKGRSKKGKPSSNRMKKKSSGSSGNKFKKKGKASGKSLAEDIMAQLKG